MSGRTRVTTGPFRRAVNGAVGITQSVLGLGLAPEAVIAERLAICRQCPQRINGHCSLCGCSLHHKVRLASQRCPDDPPRWDAVKAHGATALADDGGN